MSKLKNIWQKYWFIILLICSSISIPTLSAFVKNVEKTGTIQTKELSTAFFSTVTERPKAFKAPCTSK